MRDDDLGSIFLVPSPTKCACYFAGEPILGNGRARQFVGESESESEGSGAWRI